MPPMGIEPVIPADQSSPTPTKLIDNHDSLIRGIGEYRFIKPLGTGKFSDVVLASHYETERLVAIKVRSFNWELIFTSSPDVVIYKPKSMD
jgi:hypothetical protein